MFRSFKETEYIRHIYGICTGYIRNISEAKVKLVRPSWSGVVNKRNVYNEYSPMKAAIIDFRGQVKTAALV